MAAGRHGKVVRPNSGQIHVAIAARKDSARSLRRARHGRAGRVAFRAANAARVFATDVNPSSSRSCRRIRRSRPRADVTDDNDVAKFVESTVPWNILSIARAGSTRELSPMPRRILWGSQLPLTCAAMFPLWQGDDPEDGRGSGGVISTWPPSSREEGSPQRLAYFLRSKAAVEA